MTSVGHPAAWMGGADRSSVLSGWNGPRTPDNARIAAVLHAEERGLLGWVPPSIKADLGERSAETRFRDDRLHDGGVVTRVVCAVAGLFRAASWRGPGQISGVEFTSPYCRGEWSGPDRAGWNVPGARRHHPARRLAGQAVSLPRELPAAGRMPLVVSQVFPPRVPFPDSRASGWVTPQRRPSDITGEPDGMSWAGPWGWRRSRR
jgi:hypothetical protein